MREFLSEVLHEEWPEMIGNLYFVVLAFISITGLVIGLAAVLGLI